VTFRDVALEWLSWLEHVKVPIREGEDVPVWLSRFAHDATTAWEELRGHLDGAPAGFRLAPTARSHGQRQSARWS